MPSTIGCVDVNAFLMDCEPPNGLQRWHQRLGHIGYDRIQRAARDGALIGIDIPVSQLRKMPPICEPCVNAKMHRLAIPRGPVSYVPTEKLELVSADTAEMDVKTFSGFRYYVLSYVTRPVVCGYIL